MANVDHLKLRQEIEELLAGYHLQDAVVRLKALDFAEIPPHLRADFASLARRAHLYKEAIKMLQDRIYGGGRPEDKDLMEYASSIRKLGMVQQCLNLLERVSEHKEKYLYQGFCHVHNWDYLKAQECFEKFLMQGGLSERESVVARLNVISCYIFNGALDDADRAINAIEPLCKDKYFQFYLNCQEMRGQISIRNNRLMEASAVLARAHDAAKKETGTTSLFLEKWKLIAELPLPSAHPKDAQIAAFRKTIRLQGHWETLRDFDYHVAMFQKDSALLNYVYFGTPFESFKKRIAQNHPGQIHDHYAWTAGSTATQTLDPLDCGIEVVPFGLIQHRLLLVLLSDFYRPWSLQRIFDSLFPSEIYDVDSSPKRIYGLIKKLQDNLKSLALPFDLQSTIHGYRFRPRAGGSILIYPRMNMHSHEEILHAALHERYAVQEFTPQELSKALSISSHKAYRWTNDLEAAGLVARDPHSHRLVLKAS